MDFEALESLRRLLVSISRRQVPSLKLYYDDASGGFFHQRQKKRPNDPSKASTATVVASLLAAHRWDEGGWKDKAEVLVRQMLFSDWTSAKLDRGNVFTTAFVLELVTLLSSRAVGVLTEPESSARVETAERILRRALLHGGAKLKDYPRSAYLTQLATRVLRRRGKLTPDIAARVKTWAWHEIDHQIALISAKSKLTDYFQLAYSIIIVASLGAAAEATPDQHLLLRVALREFFRGQLPDGSWPRSLPLFHYPGVGNAYCYEYEMLTQLLAEPDLQDPLLHHLDSLAKSARTLETAAFRPDATAFEWSSGHHPQFQGPESWSTASVYHFVHLFDRLLAEAIRREIFEYLNSESYERPRDPKPETEAFAPKLLDCVLTLPDGSTQSLREALHTRFVLPITRQVTFVKDGQSMPEETPTSAIFFGPPGTSKTRLSKVVAEHLGWPLLIVDPAHFVRRGFDKIQTEADRIFTRFAVAEQIVVLLDEFDEMVRERGQEQDVLSRFLTTSMLPRLAKINENRRIVFIVATNYIDKFDLAISRRGRFDIIVQIMPPRADEKVRVLSPELTRIGLVPDAEFLAWLGDLTFDEFKNYKRDLEKIATGAEAKALLQERNAQCTLTRAAMLGTGEEQKKTWKERCAEQRERIRLG